MAIVPPSEAANQFSEFSKKKKDGPVRKALKAVFPSITDISVENNAGSSTLYCSVPWMDEKSPVALVSSGINKLLVILLGIASMSKGVIAVDELENGIYYKTYPDIWKSVLHFAERFDVQVFVSTHSMECLRAALPAMHKKEHKFRLLRCERSKSKRIVRVFDGQSFEAAMEYKTEVR
jgi:AAA15 family ATPase/GTPase